jgi:hypothetical protein
VKLVTPACSSRRATPIELGGCCRNSGEHGQRQEWRHDGAACRCAGHLRPRRPKPTCATASSHPNEATELALLPHCYGGELWSCAERERECARVSESGESEEECLASSSSTLPTRGRRWQCTASTLCACDRTNQIIRTQVRKSST